MSWIQPRSATDLIEALKTSFGVYILASSVVTARNARSFFFMSE